MQKFRAIPVKTRKRLQDLLPVHIEDCRENAFFGLAPCPWPYIAIKNEKLQTLLDRKSFADNNFPRENPDGRSLFR